jgi:hypothetical protein
MVALPALVSGLDAELVRLGYKDSTMVWYRGVYLKSSLGLLAKCALDPDAPAREADPGLSQGAGVCLRPSRAVRTIPVAR